MHAKKAIHQRSCDCENAPQHRLDGMFAFSFFFLSTCGFSFLLFQFCVCLWLFCLLRVVVGITWRQHLGMPYSRGETSRGSSPVIVVVTSFFVLLFCFLILIYACDHYCHHVWRGCAYNFADKRGVCYDQLDTLGPISRNGQWSRNGQEGRWGGVRCEVDPYVYAPQKKSGHIFPMLQTFLRKFWGPNFFGCFYGYVRTKNVLFRYIFPGTNPLLYDFFSRHTKKVFYKRFSYATKGKL